MTHEELWTFILQSLSQLPPWVQKLANLNASTLIERKELNMESKLLDSSYIDFLNQQIALEPRGPEWTEVLKKRVSVLTPYVGKTITTALLSYEGNIVTVKIDPEQKKIISIEEN